MEKYVTRIYSWSKGHFLNNLNKVKKKEQSDARLRMNAFSKIVVCPHEERGLNFEEHRDFL